MQNEDIIQCLAALTDNGIRFHQPGFAPDLPLLSGKFNRPFYIPHAHHRMEIICLVQGSMALHVDGTWLECPPQRVQVFVPGVLHGEHFAAGAPDYRLLWATVFPKILLLHTTAYDTVTGYAASKKRLAVATPMCDRLWQAAQASDLTTRSQRRGAFLAALIDNLVYFADKLQARALKTDDYHEQIAEQVAEYVRQYHWDDISLKKLAAIFHYSPGHLNTIFVRAHQVPLHRYIIEIRLRQAHALLSSGRVMVKEAALAAGFHDPLYFSRLFRRRYGHPPQRLRGSRPRAGRSP